MTRLQFLQILGIGSVAAWAGIRATAQREFDYKIGHIGELKMVVDDRHKQLGSINFQYLTPYRHLPPPEYKGPKIKYLSYNELTKRYNVL